MPEYQLTGPDDEPFLISGPIMPVQVGVPKETAGLWHQMGQAPPSPIGVRALIDTGARYNFVAPQVIETLRLKQIDEIQMATVHGVQPTRVFAGAIILLPLGREFDPAPIGELLGFEELWRQRRGGPAPPECVIGRWVLERLFFSVDGPKNLSILRTP